MSEPVKPDSLAVTLTVEQLRKLMREEISSILGDHGQGEDRFLDAKEAARLLSVSEDWLFRHSRKLPFARKLGPKMLRFSYHGIQKYLAARKL